MARWCEHCERSEGSDICAVCGADLRPAPRAPLPWKWRFFLLSTAVYVVWRIYQLVSWLAKP